MNIKMKHYINPTIDFAFKILFGAKGNEPIVTHFLNSILQPQSKITSVIIKNPFNERELAQDKLSVVDVKVEDQAHHTYQIEIQLTSPKYLKHRVLLNWSQIYSKQIKKGESFNKLKPVVAIWLLTENIEDDLLYHHHYQLIDDKNGKKFSDHCSIHLLELRKWELPQHTNGTLSDEDIWPFFFTHAHKWLELPDIANTTMMGLAMKVLQQISDESAQYERYIARERYKMDRLTDQEDLQEEKDRRLQAEQRAEELAQKVDEELKLRQVEQLRADELAKRVEEQAKRAEAAEQQYKKLQQQMEALTAKSK